jgi:hypothetical protein
MITMAPPGLAIIKEKTMTLITTRKNMELQTRLSLSTILRIMMFSAKIKLITSKIIIKTISSKISVVTIKIMEVRGVIQNRIIITAEEEESITKISVAITRTRIRDSRIIGAM